MDFVSSGFVLFFAIVWIATVLLRFHNKPYKYMLVLASLISYSFWDIRFLAILMGSILVNYYLISFIESSSKKSKLRKWLLWVGVLANVVFLGVFKYYSFFVESLTELFYSLEIDWALPAVSIIVPVGVSFFTFRNLSHLIDSYRGKVKLQGLASYTLYISFFPQVVSGPITRAGDFYADMKRHYVYDQENVIVLLLSGAFKKLVLASFLYTIVQDPFTSPENYYGLDLVLAMFGYGALIFVDFSGYSDIAEGISNILGFRVPKNFAGPYSAKTVQKFQRKWHVTLSDWLKDYLYIPLGGSRKGRIRTYINLMIVMVLGGLWHGANFTFIVWGAIHGVALVLTHFILSLKKSKVKNKILGKLLGFGSWLLTFLTVHIAWVFFNSASIDIAISYLTRMFSNFSFTSIIYTPQLVLVIILVLAINFWGRRIAELTKTTLKNNGFLFKLAFILVAVYIILQLGPEEVPPFIYFNF